jgi:aldehyde dehydrogenase (NAD+)
MWCFVIFLSFTDNTLFVQLFINNEWHKSKSGKTFESFNPTTGKVITQVQQGDKVDIDVAVQAAKTAFK